MVKIAGVVENPKLTKDAAEYHAADDIKDRCGSCAMFVPPCGCTLVHGYISPDYVCDYFSVT